jgi:hypothetical protein
VKIHLVQNKCLALSLKHVFGLIDDEAKKKTAKTRRNFIGLGRLRHEVVLIMLELSEFGIHKLSENEKRETGEKIV